MFTVMDEYPISLGHSLSIYALPEFKSTYRNGEFAAHELPRPRSKKRKASRRAMQRNKARCVN